MVLINKELFPNFNIGDNFPPIIQGVINISPESFYKGSIFKVDQINGQFQKFLDNGVKIFDVGARSTAPGVAPITKEEELARIKPFLNVIVNNIPNSIILSIDTQYSEIAEYSIKFCSEHNFRVIINDVSGLRTDPNMAKIIVDYNVPLILMASNQKPGDILSVNSILENIFNNILTLEKLNYDINKLIIDPGIGKWIPAKTYEYDLAIIDNLERFRVFNQPICVGLSRKSFIGTVLNKQNPSDRYFGTLAATTIAIYNGAHIIRTHDATPELNEMITMAHAIRKRPLIIQENDITGILVGCVKDPLDGRYLQRLIGVTPAGSRIMDRKMVTKIILIENITAPQALILKEEMLARGGDTAIHKDVITTENAKYKKNQKVLLIGTEKQLYALVDKLKGQQLELDKIGRIVLTLLEKSREDKFLHSIY